MNTIADFTTLVKLCLKIAGDKYGDLGHVDIRYDIRGQCAGQARCRRDRISGKAFDLCLRFNKEALAKDWAHMVKETIPHEVAHLVAYARPELGADNHNSQWERIARSLGCSGNRCHTMALTSARRTFRYRYVTPSGDVVVCRAKHHNLIQAYGAVAGVRSRKTREVLDRHHFKEKFAA